tara:strand:- start:3013 stop:3420 length:408 start_codon:yes stop_codon:yes gene_type:complete
MSEEKKNCGNCKFMHECRHIEYAKLNGNVCKFHITSEILPTIGLLTKKHKQEVSFDLEKEDEKIIVVSRIVQKLNDKNKFIAAEQAKIKLIKQAEEEAKRLFPDTTSCYKINEEEKRSQGRFIEGFIWTLEQLKK